jgi:hypothetical protein
MNVFQLNKLSKLHDGKNVFFTKTDYLREDFIEISKLDNEVILISGNSDLVIDEPLINSVPSNVKTWFATNVISENPKIIPIPLGIENYKPSVREGHGIGYNRGLAKENFILNHKNRKPTKFIYSNCRRGTNPVLRDRIIDISKKNIFITWEEPTLSHEDFEDFFDRILDFEAVLCPQGNGFGDNHRIYETLYLNRIPITTGPHVHKSLHHKFPVVLIEDINLLNNYDFMKEQVEIAKTKEWDKSLLDLDYWESKILSLM